MHGYCGIGRATQIQTILMKSGIDIKYLVGRDYDSAAAMVGIRKGGQKPIGNECPEQYTRTVPLIRSIYSY